MKETNRIPFNNWINSHLSIAKFYWWISVNGKQYEYDREYVKENIDKDTPFKPDLVYYWQ